MELNIAKPEPLTQLARAQAWIGPEDNITHLEIAGDGNMNRVLRGYLAKGGTRIFKQSLPYVAKYPDVPAPIERGAVEAAFYATIQQDSVLTAATPQVLGYDQSNHLLCLQDLGDARDFTFLYQAQTDNTREDFLEPLLNWLSHLHSLQLNSAEKHSFANHAMRKLNHQHIFEIPLSENNGVILSDLLAHTALQLSHDTALSDKRAQLGDIYLGHTPPRASTCLLHGDYYPASWMANVQGEVFVIDPEFAFYGPAEFDIGVLLAHLKLTGRAQSVLVQCLASYRAPAGFELDLAWQFAGIEIMRRLLGVAQLPLDADEKTKLAWLNQARSWL